MLFHGIACFSPSVHASLRAVWVKHGGSLTHSKEDFLQASVFFCDGPHDPWLKELLSRSLIVRHARWISKSVSEQFAVPVSKYILDDQFDPTKIQPAPQCRTPSLPTSPARKNSRLNLSPAFAEALQTATKPNTLKRSLDSENHDDSLTEIDLRPLKRPRIQPALSPSASRTLVSIQPPVALPSPVLPITVFPACTTRTKSYPSPANSSPIKTPNPKPNPRASKPVDPGVRRIDFTTLKATPALPVLTLPCSRPGRPRTRKHCNNRTHDTLLEPVEHVASGPPRTSIAELLRAPRAEACVFDVSETYRAKVFTCLKVPKPSTCSGTAQPPVLKYDTAPL